MPIRLPSWSPPALVGLALRRLALVLPAFALIAVTLAATPAGASLRGTLPDVRDSLEVSVHLGVAGGGTFSGWRDQDNVARGDLPLETGTAFGAALAWGSEGRRVLELAWTHVDARVDEQSPPAGVEPFGVAVSVDDWLLEGAAQWGPFRGRHRLRAGPHLGMSRFVSNNVVRWRPTLGVGGGTRSRLGGRWIVRTHLRLRLTHIGSQDPFLCGPNGRCYTFRETDWMGRWELAAGVAFLL